MEARIGRSAGLVSALVVAGWSAAFAAGAVSPLAGVKLIAALAFRAASSLSAPKPEPRLTVSAGDSLAASALAGLRRLAGDFGLLLAVRIPDTPRRASTRHYLTLLADRYRSRGLATAPLGDPGAEDPAAATALRMLGLDSVRAGTVMVERSGRVRFASVGEASPDLLRQLAERSLFGRAETVFDVVPTDIALWEERLARAALTNRDGAPVSARELLDAADLLVVFEAHCSACRIRADVQLLRRLAATPGRRRITALFPQHYLPGLGASGIDSVGVEVVIAGVTLAPELAYISRDVPQSAPTLLRVAGGRIVDAASLERERVAP